MLKKLANDEDNQVRFPETSPENPPVDQQIQNSEVFISQKASIINQNISNSHYFNFLSQQVTDVDEVSIEQVISEYQRVLQNSASPKDIPIIVYLGTSSEKIELLLNKGVIVAEDISKGLYRVVKMKTGLLGSAVFTQEERTEMLQNFLRGMRSAEQLVKDQRHFEQIVKNFLLAKGASREDLTALSAKLFTDEDLIDIAYLNSLINDYKDRPDRINQQLQPFQLTEQNLPEAVEKLDAYSLIRGIIQLVMDNAEQDDYLTKISQLKNDQLQDVSTVKNTNGLQVDVMVEAARILAIAQYNDLGTSSSAEKLLEALQLNQIHYSANQNFKGRMVPKAELEKIFDGNIPLEVQAILVNPEADYLVFSNSAITFINNEVTKQKPYYEALKELFFRAGMTDSLFYQSIKTSHLVTQIEALSVGAVIPQAAGSEEIVEDAAVKADPRVTATEVAEQLQESGRVGEQGAVNPEAVMTASQSENPIDRPGVLDRTETFKISNKFTGQAYSYRLEMTRINNKNSLFILENKETGEILQSIDFEIGDNKVDFIYETLAVNAEIKVPGLTGNLSMIEGLNIDEIINEDGLIKAHANDYLLDVLQGKTEVELTEQQELRLKQLLDAIENQLRALESNASDIQRRMEVMAYTPVLSSEDYQSLHVINDRFMMIEAGNFTELLGETAASAFSKYLDAGYYVFDMTHQRTELEQLITAQKENINGFVSVSETINSMLSLQQLLLVDISASQLSGIDPIASNISIPADINAGKLTAEDILKLKEFYRLRSMRRIMQQDIFNNLQADKIHQMVRQNEINQDVATIGRGTKYKDATFWKKIKDSFLLKNLSFVDNGALALTFTLAASASLINPLVSLAALFGFGYFATRKIFMSIQGNKTARQIGYVRKEHGDLFNKEIKLDRDTWKALENSGLLDNSDFNFFNGIKINKNKHTIRFSYSIDFDKAFLPLMKIISSAKGEIERQIKESQETNSNKNIRELKEALGALESLKNIVNHRAAVDDLGRWERQYATEWFIEVDEDFQLPTELQSSPGIMLHEDPEYLAKYGKKILQINYMATNSEISKLISSDAVKNSIQVDKQELFTKFPQFNESNVGQYFEEYNGKLIPKMDIDETVKGLLGNEDVYHEFIDFINEKRKLMADIAIASTIVHRNYNTEIVNALGYENLSPEARAKLAVEGTSTFGAPNFTFSKLMETLTKQLYDTPFLMTLMMNSDARSNFTDVVTGQINRIHRYEVQRDIIVDQLEDVLVFDKEIANGRSLNKYSLALDLVDVDGHIDGGNIAVALSEAAAEAFPAEGFTRFLLSNMLRRIDLWLNEDGLPGSDSLEPVNGSKTRNKEIVFEIDGKKEAENDTQITLLTLLKRQNDYFTRKHNYRFLSDSELEHFVSIYQRRYQIFEMEQEFCHVVDKLRSKIELSPAEVRTFKEFLTTKYALSNDQALAILEQYQEKVTYIQQLVQTKLQERDNTHVFSYANNPAVDMATYEALLAFGSYENFVGHRGANEGYEHYIFDLPTVQQNLISFFKSKQLNGEITEERFRELEHFVIGAAKEIKGGKGNGGALELLRREIEYSLRKNFSDNNWDKKISGANWRKIGRIFTGIPGEAEKNMDTVKSQEASSLMAVFSNQMARAVQANAAGHLSSYQEKIIRSEAIRNEYPELSYEQISRRIWLEDLQKIEESASNLVKNTLFSDENKELLQLIFGEQNIDQNKVETLINDIVDSLMEALNLSRLYEETTAEGLKSGFAITQDEFYRAAAAFQRDSLADELTKIGNTLEIEGVHKTDAFDQAMSLYSNIANLDQKNFGGHGSRKGFPLTFMEINQQIQDKISGLLYGVETAYSQNKLEEFGDIIVEPFGKQVFKGFDDQEYAGGIENKENYQDIPFFVYERDKIKLNINKYISELAPADINKLIESGVIKKEGENYFVEKNWQKKNISKDLRNRFIENVIDKQIEYYQNVFRQAAEHMAAIEQARIDLTLIMHGEAGVYSKDLAYNLADSIIKEYIAANGNKSIADIANYLDFMKFYYGNFFANKYHIIAGKSAKNGNIKLPEALLEIFSNFNEVVADNRIADPELIDEARSINTTNSLNIDKNPNWEAKGHKPQNFNGMYLGYTAFEQMQKMIKVALKKYRKEDGSRELISIWNEMKEKLMRGAISHELKTIKYRGVESDFMRYMDLIMPFISAQIESGIMDISTENMDQYDLRNDNNALINSLFNQAIDNFIKADITDIQDVIRDKIIAEILSLKSSEDPKTKITTPEQVTEQMIVQYIEGMKQHALKIQRSLISKSEAANAIFDMNIDKDNWIYDFAVSLASGTWQLDIDGRPHYGERLVMAQGNQDMTYSKYVTLARAAVQDMVDFIHTMSTVEGAKGMHPSTGCGQWRNRVDDLMWDYVREVYDIQPKEYQFSTLKDNWIWQKVLKKPVFGTENYNIGTALIELGSGASLGLVVGLVASTLATGGLAIPIAVGLATWIITSAGISQAMKRSLVGHVKVGSNKPMTKAELTENLLSNIDTSVLAKGFMINVAPVIFSASLLWAGSAAITAVFGSALAIPTIAALGIKAIAALVAFTKVNDLISSLMRRIVQIHDRYDFAADKAGKEHKTPHLFNILLPKNGLIRNPLLYGLPFIASAVAMTMLTGLGLGAATLLTAGIFPVVAAGLAYGIHKITAAFKLGLTPMFDPNWILHRLQYSSEENSVEDFKEGESIFLGDLYSKNYLFPMFSAPAEGSPVVVVDVQFPRWNLSHIELIRIEQINAKIAERLHHKTGQYAYLHSRNEQQFHHMSNDDKYPMITPTNFTFNYPFLFTIGTGISIFSFVPALIGLGIAPALAVPAIFGAASIMLIGYRALMGKIAKLHDSQGLNEKFRRAGNYRDVEINMGMVEKIRLKLYSLAKAPFTSSEPIEISLKMHFSDIYKEALTKIALPMALPALIGSKLAVTIPAMLAGGVTFGTAAAAVCTGLLAGYLFYWAAASFIRFVRGPIRDISRNNVTVSSNSSLNAGNGGVMGRYISYDNQNHYFRLETNTQYILTIDGKPTELTQNEYNERYGNSGYITHLGHSYGYSWDDKNKKFVYTKDGYQIGADQIPKKAKAKLDKATDTHDAMKELLEAENTEGIKLPNGETVSFGGKNKVLVYYEGNERRFINLADFDNELPLRFVEELEEGSGKVPYEVVIDQSEVLRVFLKGEAKDINSINDTEQRKRVVDLFNKASREYAIYQKYQELTYWQTEKNSINEQISQFRNKYSTEDIKNLKVKHAELDSEIVENNNIIEDLQNKVTDAYLKQSELNEELNKLGKSIKNLRNFKFHFFNESGVLKLRIKHNNGSRIINNAQEKIFGNDHILADAVAFDGIVAEIFSGNDEQKENLMDYVKTLFKIQEINLAIQKDLAEISEKDQKIRISESKLEILNGVIQNGQ